MSHVPAIKGLPGIKLAAVATRHERTAREAAQAFGAERWLSDPFVMIQDDQIDVVTVAVKVPAHRELVLAALKAGKAVFCEAPFGRDVAVLGKTQSGAIFTAEIYGGVAPQDTRSSFEIRGSEAWLSVTSDHPYGIHAGQPTLNSNIPFVTPDEPVISGGFMGAAINVGEVYAHLVPRSA